MFWVRLFFILAIAASVIFFINTKLKNKGLIIFLTTYIVATLFRAFTGFSFNIFHDKFDIILFIIDIMIWTLSYLGVSLIISKFTKSNGR